MTQAITGKKLKIWSASDPSQVVVFQDGTASDADATMKFDNGFRDGYSFPQMVPGSTFRMSVSGMRLSARRDGKTFEFRIQDWVNFNNLQLAAGDRVEFWCDQEAVTSSGSFRPGMRGASALAKRSTSTASSARLIGFAMQHPYPNWSFSAWTRLLGPTT